MNKTYTSYYLNDQLNIDRKLIEFRYQTIKSYFKGTSCLEMGPAEGVMTQYLVGHFDNLDIVDGDKVLLDLIPPYNNVVKFHCWFENFTPPRKYDTIIMEHVLEHLIDPQVVLERAKQWLNRDGVIIAGVPNAKSFHRLAAVKMGLLDNEHQLNERDRSLGHHRVYDLHSLEIEFSTANLSIIHKGGVFLKPLSNKQIESNWSMEMINAFYELGKDFQHNAAEIYVVASIS